MLTRSSSSPGRARPPRKLILPFHAQRGPSLEQEGIPHEEDEAVEGSGGNPDEHVGFGHQLHLRQDARQLGGVVLGKERIWRGTATARTKHVRMLDGLNTLFMHGFEKKPKGRVGLLLINFPPTSNASRSLRERKA